MQGLWASLLPRLMDRLTAGLQLRDLVYAAAGLAVALAFWLWLVVRGTAAQRTLPGSDVDAARKAEFLATLGHQIRVPLEGLFDLAGAVARADLESRRPELSKALQKNSAALLAAANDVLALCNYESGVVPPEITTFNLRAMIEQGVRLYTPRARARGLSFKTAISSRLPQWVKGDPSSVLLVFMNLLENAVKFTDEGVVRLEVALLADTFGRPSVRFTVSDTGIGIDSETLARLLESSEDADPLASHPYRTTGLGLAVSRRLVAALGGTIGAESEPRGGSTFWFRVPVEIVQAAPAPPRKAARRPWKRPVMPKVAPVRPLLPLACQPDRRILIVEGEAAAQAALLWAVRTLGYHGEVVSTRQDALQAWACDPFDLVLLDCDTPGVEGAATAACLRECEVGARRIPIVAMAAQRAGEEQTASWTSPIDGQIARPVCLEALAAVLERWLGSPAVQARAASSESLSLPV